MQTEVVQKVAGMQPVDCRIIGIMLLSEVKPLYCLKILSDMADEDYRTSKIYQTRIALFNSKGISEKP